MNSLSIGLIFVGILVGYLIGSLNFAIIVSKILGWNDIRKIGSGNAGATNMMRSHGKVVGISVAFLDIAKPIFSGLIMFFAAQGYNDWGLTAQFSGFFSVIGHIYPIFFKFKGGKGVAAGAGFLFTINWLLFVIFVVVFLTVLITSRIVSLASLLGLSLTLPCQIGFSFADDLQSTTFNLYDFSAPWYSGTILIFAIALLVTVRHRKNIIALWNKNERQTNLFDQSKSKTKTKK